ncbi:hypothetical protein F480_00480 [Bibersteinia trehalosi Y31]|uniref:Uncharacterized protein n=1 Tax=Bibersteinia trehalosi Y31 TaxID=1261658 RepID=A0A179D0V6_BIBTR|nr:hypothetical protein F480_00480 [Bibersteinia trehalosi Y31]
MKQRYRLQTIFSKSLKFLNFFELYFQSLV